MRKYQTMWKRHQARKDFNKRKRERELNARIFIKLWEDIDLSKDIREMRFHERSFKLRRMIKNEDSSREEIQSNWGRWGKEKVRYISSKKCVKSSKEKWKCIRKDKRVSRRNANSSRKDRSLSNWKKQKMQLSESQQNSKTIPKKKKKKLARLKTRKGGLGKN